MTESESSAFEWVTPADLEPTDTRYEIDDIEIENDDHPNELAIFDASSESALTQTWISATGDSFTDLKEVR